MWHVAMPHAQVSLECWNAFDIEGKGSVICVRYSLIFLPTVPLSFGGCLRFLCVIFCCCFPTALYNGLRQWAFLQPLTVGRQGLHLSNGAVRQRNRRALTALPCVWWKMGGKKCHTQKASTLGHWGWHFGVEKMAFRDGFFACFRRWHFKEVVL